MHGSIGTRSLVIRVAVLWAALATAHAALLLNEILFNPPGADAPQEFIEIRGTPNARVPANTWLLAIEGDAGNNPGVIQNVFDLSARAIGGNGFLLLLQKGHEYLTAPGAVVVTNMNGSGWGSGSSSTVAHRGENGQTDLVNASVTFLLIESSPSSIPRVGTDLDADNNGELDTAFASAWLINDAVGVLDGDGAGDMAYGKINFRRNIAPGNGALASGTVVLVGFTPSYIARAGNSRGWTADDWIASDNLVGTFPAFFLGNSASTAPPVFAGQPLDHLGAPNFTTEKIPGILVGSSDAKTEVTEGAASNSILIALNTAAAGLVVIRLECAPGLELSLDGESFGSSGELSLISTTPQRVHVRVPDDHFLEVSPRELVITGRIARTEDPQNYPMEMIVPEIPVVVHENDFVRFNEMKINPPGTTDAPNEWIELVGPPGLHLKEVILLGLDGESGADPGKAVYWLDLSSVQLGANGLGLIVPPEHSHAIPAETAVILDPQLSGATGGLGNGAGTFLLISTRNAPVKNADLDNGDNGIAEGLPADASVLDSIAFAAANVKSVLYTSAVLKLSQGIADAATRKPGDLEPNSAGSWIFGDLLGPAGETLDYDFNQLSSGFPAGSRLTPGNTNRFAPLFAHLQPVSGVIGDVTNPPLLFSVADADDPAAPLTIIASSSNPGVVPDANLTLRTLGSGAYALDLDPVGVGYSTISVWAGNGSLTGRVAIPYAASAPGRPGGVWHLAASDGSTAIPLNSDFMLLGDDENQIIRLYRRHESGVPLAVFDMTQFLGLPDRESGQPREVDIEASTRVGDRIFWMGSFSHAEIGETRTNRTRVFATDLLGVGQETTLQFAGRYDFLKLDLIRWDAENRHGKGAHYYGLEASDAEGVPPKAPDGSGLAIEGLAMMPGSTRGAYLAFRAPIVPAALRQFALIVPVLNFTELAVSGAPEGSAIFGAPIELNLFGRGIRSLESNGTDFLIVAGPAGLNADAYPNDFKLYTWSGLPSDQPRQRSADLSGLNPEGIIELPQPPWNPESIIELLSDNGFSEMYGDGIRAKSLPIPNFKKCRSDRVALGEIVLPQPAIVSITRNAAGLTMTWRALPGESYQLQAAEDLAGLEWINLSEPIRASVALVSHTVTMEAAPRRFFRVVALR